MACNVCWRVCCAACGRQSSTAPRAAQVVGLEQRVEALSDYVNDYDNAGDEDNDNDASDLW